MLYKLDFTVEYDDTMAQQGLLGVWAEEANAALGAKSAGVVVDLWKVVGERKVLVIGDVETADDLDRILFDLPIMQKTHLSLTHDSASHMMQPPIQQIFLFNVIRTASSSMYGDTGRSREIQREVGRCREM